MSNSAAATSWVAVIGLLLHAVGCGGGSPRIQGITKRVVGDKVTLSIVEGDAAFATDAAAARLTDSSGTVYASDADGAALRLTVTSQSKHSIEVLIPKGVAPGPANLIVRRAESHDSFTVPLNIDRVALALSAASALLFVPLPPGNKLATTTLPVQPVDSASLSPNGRAAAFLTKGDVAFADVARATRKDTWSLRASESVAGAKLVAALDDGAIVASDDAITVLRYGNDGKLNESKLGIADTKALAVADDGLAAAALVACDPNSAGGAKTGGCVIRIHLSAQNPSADRPVALNAPNTASLIAITSDGRRIVVAADELIHGVDFAGFDANPQTDPLVSEATIDTQARPTGLARAPARFQNLGPSEVFVVADGPGKSLRAYYFNSQSTIRLIDNVEIVSLDGRATGRIDFGRGLDLYAATDDGKLFLVEYGTDLNQQDDSATKVKPRVTELPLDIPADPVVLAVQP